MDAEATIKSMMLRYPSLFTFRSDAIDHLLFVIGNGYEWVNGELLHIGGVGRSEDSIHKFVENEEGLTMFQDVHPSDLYVRSFVRLHLDKLATTKTPFWNLYPESEYSRINRQPDDITDSWKELCEEARQTPTRTTNGDLSFHNLRLYYEQRFIAMHELVGRSLPPRESYVWPLSSIPRTRVIENA